MQFSPFYYFLSSLQAVRAQAKPFGTMLAVIVNQKSLFTAETQRTQSRIRFPLSRLPTGQAGGELESQTEAEGLL